MFCCILAQTSQLDKKLELLNTTAKRQVSKAHFSSKTGENDRSDQRINGFFLLVGLLGCLAWSNLL
jgi:hypothetical protein